VREVMHRPVAEMRLGLYATCNCSSRQPSAGPYGLKMRCATTQPAFLGRTAFPSSTLLHVDVLLTCTHTHIHVTCMSSL
jgi:hypothetical protein